MNIIIILFRLEIDIFKRFPITEPLTKRIFTQPLPQLPQLPQLQARYFSLPLTLKMCSYLSTSERRVPWMATIGLAQTLTSAPMSIIFQIIIVASQNLRTCLRALNP